MSENVSNQEVNFSDPAMLEKVFEDGNLRSLKLNSDEFKAALDGMSSKTEEETDAPAGDEAEQDGDAEDDTQDDDGEQKPAKKPRGMLKRIEKLVSEKRDLERELEAYRLSQQAPAAQQQATPHDDYDVPKPKFADFDSIDEYTEALTEWKLDKREADKAAEAETKAIRESAKTIAATWEAREATVKQEFADYTAVVNLESLQATDPSPEARVFLAESEIGPRVIYTLLTDDDLLDTFVKGSPVQQVRLLSRLEAQLEGATPSVKTKTQSIATKAPTPPKLLPKTKTTVTGKDLIQHAGEMSDAEWLRMADEYARNKRRK